MITTKVRNWGLGLLMVFMLACAGLGTQPVAVPTNTPILTTTLTPFQPATRTPFQPASQTPTQTPSLTAEIPSLDCPTAEEMQEKLRLAALAADADGSAKGWEAKDALVVHALIDTTTNEDRQFACLYALTLWEESVGDAMRNVEKYTQADLQTLLSVAQTIEPDAYIALYDWIMYGQVLGKSQVAGMNALNVNTGYGGIYLYTRSLLPTKTPTP